MFMQHIAIENLFLIDIETVSEKEHFHLLDNEWQLRIKSLCSENESEILNQFNATLKQLHANNHQWIFTGHNIKEFDVPFLCRRMLINNISIPSYIDFQNMKPWETPVLD